MNLNRLNTGILYFLIVLLSLWIFDLRRTIRNLSIEIDYVNQRIQKVCEEFADELVAEQEYVSHELFCDGRACSRIYTRNAQKMVNLYIF